MIKVGTVLFLVGGGSFCDGGLGLVIGFWSFCLVGVLVRFGFGVCCVSTTVLHEHAGCSHALNNTQFLCGVVE